MVVLARLISPSEFGAAVLALVFQGFSLVIANEAFATPVVQRDEIDTRFLSAAHLASCACGALLTVVVLVLSYPLGEPLFGAETARLIQFSAPMFLIAGLGAVSGALIQRELDFRLLAIFDVLAVVVLVVISIPLAAVGAGGLSIVLGSVAGSAFITLASLVKAPVQARRFPLEDLKSVLAFGAPAAGAGLAQAAYRSVQYAVVGVLLSPAQVGYFSRAYSMAVDYQSKITVVVWRVAFPIFARAQDDGELQRARLRINQAQAALILPLFVAVVPLAPYLFPVLLGPAWDPAVVPAQILAAVGVCTLLRNTVPSYILAAGRPARYAYFNLACLVVVGIGTFLAAGHGLVVVCTTIATVEVFVLLASYALLLAPIGGPGLRDLWLEAAGPVLASVLAATCCLVLVTGLSRFGAGDGLILATGAPTFLLLYLAALRLLSKPGWNTVRLFFQRLTPSAAR